MAEERPFQGNWLEANNRTFWRMIGMFKWIIIVGMLVLAALWAFTA